MDESKIARILKQWAAPREGFREDLLQRCLAALPDDGCRELSDEELELLAAAGEGAYLPPLARPYDQGGISGDDAFLNAR